MINILIEVRFHGRGGQGVVTAADLLAIAGFKEGYWTLSFPMFGAEKRGTPVTSYLRLSDEPIVFRDEIYQPNYVIVLDPTVIGPVKVDAGIKENGIIVVNYPKSAEELREKYFKDLDDSIKIVTINATRMALDILGKPITNTAMVGAFAGVTKLIKIETLKETVYEWFKGKEDVAEKNVKLVEEAYKAVEGKL